MGVEERVHAEGDGKKCKIEWLFIQDPKEDEVMGS